MLWGADGGGTVFTTRHSFCHCVCKQCWLCNNQFHTTSFSSVISMLTPSTIKKKPTPNNNQIASAGFAKGKRIPAYYNISAIEKYG